MNADDFGLSPGVNAGVAEAFRRGILTSATALANAPHFRDAVGIAAGLPGLGVGLHLNLVRGAPLSPPGEIPDLTMADGRFRPFRMRRLTSGVLLQAEREYRRQFELALSAGLSPTHIDFEKHHAWQGKLHRLACRLAAEYGVEAVRNFREPVAWCVRRLGWPGFRRFAMAAALRGGAAVLGASALPLVSPDRLLGQSHIGAVTERVLLRLIRHIPEGVSELMTHPGRRESGASGVMGASWLAGAREAELAALTSPAVAAAVSGAGVALVSFRALSDCVPKAVPPVEIGI